MNEENKLWPDSCCIFHHGFICWWSCKWVARFSPEQQCFLLDSILKFITGCLQMGGTQHLKDIYCNEKWKVCVFSLPSGFHHSNILNMTSILNQLPSACLPDIRPSLFWSDLSNSYIELSRFYQRSLNKSRLFPIHCIVASQWFFSPWSCASKLR